MSHATKPARDAVVSRDAAGPARAAVAALHLARDVWRGPAERHRATLGIRVRLAQARFRRRIEARHERSEEVVAIVLLEHLGDLVAASPIARQVRARRPNARIVWITRRPYRALAAAIPDVDEVWTLGCLTEWLRLADRLPFDDTYDLHLPGRYCEVCYLVKQPDPGNPATVDTDDYYARGSLLDAFRALAGFEPDENGEPTLSIPSHAAARVDGLDLPTGLVVLHTRSNQESRDWNDEGWRRVVDRLHDLGCPVAEIGARASFARERADVLDLCGELSILETAEVLRRARLFVGVDSGPAHLANAVGVPGVLILGRYRHFEGHVPWSGHYASDVGATIVRAEGAPASAVDADAVLAAIDDGLERTATVPGLVSVVVPTYGHAALVGETLASVAEQSWPDVETIVVDDGSPDDTERALAGWRDRIRYMRQSNRGVAAARNAGLRIARGEFVAFLDDDDLWPPDKLERQVSLLRADPRAVLAWGRHAFIGREEESPTTGSPPTGDVARAFLRRNWIHSVGQTLMRTVEVRAIGGFDERIRSSDDYDLYIRLARRGRFVFDDHLALRYRLHEGNASRGASDHARQHWKVVDKHMRWWTRRRHARAAAAYFVPNLVAAARDAAKDGASADAARALTDALRFQPSLIARPWFVRALVAHSWRAARASRRATVRSRGEPAR